MKVCIFKKISPKLLPCSGNSDESGYSFGCQSGPENFKKSRPKKFVKSNKSISRKNSIFYNFKNGQKSIFELGKSLKVPKMQFHEKKIDLYDFTSFFATFDDFLSGVRAPKALQNFKKSLNHRPRPRLSCIFIIHGFYIYRQQGRSITYGINPVIIVI